MPPLEIQRLQPSDAARLRALAYRCYPPFYAYLWHPGGMEAYLEAAFDEQLLAAELANPNLVYEAVQIQGVDVAFVKWHRREDTDDLSNAAYLERVYVAPEVAGQRVGSVLVDRVLTAARQEGRQWIWLRAMADIDKVLARYRAAGFETFKRDAITTAGIRTEHAGMAVMRCALT
jgi:GNAT superfamily N-acetyltransferase